MHLEAHAGFGWAVGTLAPGSDRRLRNCCVAAAVLPDIDAVAFLWGPEAYSRWHHTFGHNVWLGLAFVGLCVWWHRDRSWGRRGLVAGLVGVCWMQQLVTDAYFTRYPVYWLWPLNRDRWLCPEGMWLGAWPNEALVYVAMASVIPLALWRKVTPLDVFWPRLDRIVVGAFRRKELRCAECEAPCNTRCDACARPVCLRHGSVQRGFRIGCGCGGKEEFSNAE